MVEYEKLNGASRRQIRISLDNGKTIDEFGYRMVKQNKIAGLVGMDRSIQNDRTIYDYDVTGLISFEAYYEGKKIELADIREMYEKVLKVLLKSENYFLDRNSFLINPELLFFSEQTREYCLLYCPEEKQEIKEQLADLTEYIMNRLKYEDQRSVAFVYELFKQLRDGHSTLNELLAFVQTGRVQKATPPPVYDQPQQEAPRNMRIEQQGGLDKNEIYQVHPANTSNEICSKKLLCCIGMIAAGLIVFASMYFAGVLFIAHTQKLDMSRTAGTAILISAIVIYLCYRVYGCNSKRLEDKPIQKAQPMRQIPPAQQVQPMPQMPPAQPMPPIPPMNPAPIMKQYAEKQEVEHKPERYRLIDTGAGSRQQYILYKSPYLIGKSAEQVDGVIYSDAVSRVHAEFIMEQGRIYIIDMSSTNGTYVNHKRIQSNERIAINEGDCIRVADKQFRLVS